MTRLPEYKSDVVMQATLHIAQAEIYAVSALYTEAISELEKVPHSLINHEHADLQLYYFRTKRTLYGWMSDYTKIPTLHHLWAEKTMNYRDSLLSIKATQGVHRAIIQADKYNALGQPQKAIALLRPYVNKMSESNPMPYICLPWHMPTCWPTTQHTLPITSRSPPLPTSAKALANIKLCPYWHKCCSAQAM